jgi:hypothetical protein
MLQVDALHYSMSIRNNAFCIPHMTPETRKLLELARPAFERMKLESLRLARLREWRAAVALYAR